MADAGRQSHKSSTHSSPQSSTFAVLEPNYDDDESAKLSFAQRIWRDFQRDPRVNRIPVPSLGADGRGYDAEGAAQATANSPLARKLKGRHLQMIAIGGSIGITYSAL